MYAGKPIQDTNPYSLILTFSKKKKNINIYIYLYTGI